ncbi:MAG TPA: ABC transporter ATP-binding protein [Ktedonobacter sp.]|jgi:branched-chain amino acid transport system ATP-binding protein|nr:ABC transporter ATP-binding protein [Ktedonobacter sp.]HAT46563.1 ABC transporter ATP-binding protein [Ktedonobacter sp.]HBE25038.1 ABC transporter ATP-binding protein [Ktedonobacter sp.]HCF87621.1 ABC transporter ATP-binding protein [Ktedonobacter sp.]HCJ33832.1 ABC transporter ATP-binding protein [Ktedonobacter sp.]
MFLKLHNIYAGYEGGDVLKGIDLAVEKGTTTCIVGPNGAGKSTVLRVLSGLLKPRLGEITFDGRSIAGLTPRQILALGIVQVQQSHSLFPSMTVQENVRLGAFMLHDSALVERRLHEVEEMFPIVKTRARDKAGSLSGGQQRLVEFARCLMLDPRLILLDEPSMGLDPRTFKQVVETIKEMQSSGRTIVLVEQNARTGLSLSTNGVVLESGRVRLEGPHADILNNPEIGHLYLGGTLSKA